MTVSPSKTKRMWGVPLKHHGYEAFKFTTAFVCFPTEKTAQRYRMKVPTATIGAGDVEEVLVTWSTPSKRKQRKKATP